MPTGERVRWTLVCIVIAAAVAMPLRGLLRTQGPPMEEGFMLAFPEFVLHGLRPNADFLHLYGPGSLWALAGAYRLFGVSLATERWFGLTQILGVVAGVVGLARHWGQALTLAAGLLCVLILTPAIGLTALAWDGALALALLGLLLTLEARRSISGARSHFQVIAAGMLFGLSLTFRLDLVVAVMLGGAAASIGTGRKFRIRLSAGFLIGVSPYLAHLATAGPGVVFRGMILDPVVFLRGGRSLPVPPSWGRIDAVLQRVGLDTASYWPAPFKTSAQLNVWFWLLLFATVSLLATAVFAYRREPSRTKSWVLLSVACFSLGLLPQAIQRTDSTHLAWVSCVAVAFLPISAAETLHLLRPRSSTLTQTMLGTALALTVVFGLIPHFTVRTYTDYTAQSFSHRRSAMAITRGNRLFYYGSMQVQIAAEQLLARIDMVSRPGDRLFVGTSDLRKTPYSDAYLYYLLPDHPPATYYVEMDPGVANREGSRMPDDLRSADLVVLSSIWRYWSEPNDSRRFGSLASSRVLARDFCVDGTFGDGIYQLLTRRPPGVPCPEGTRTPRPPGL